MSNLVVERIVALNVVGYWSVVNCYGHILYFLLGHALNFLAQGVE